MLFEMTTKLQREPVRTLGGAVREAFRTAFQLILFLLMVLGIGGIFYKAVSPGGWLLDALDSAWNRGPAYLFFVILGILAGGAWLRRFMYRRPAVNSRTGDAMAAGLIAAGIFFCVEIVSGGIL